MSLLGNFSYRTPSSGQEVKISFWRSQLILADSRKRWGLIYALATVVGLFSIPTGSVWMASDIEALLLTLPLPFSTFLIILSMYVLNDLVDADLDRKNGKDRPIASGKVSKLQAKAFLILTGGAGAILAIATLNPASMISALLILSIGLLYSAPKISLKDRFVVKTMTIAIAIAASTVMGATPNIDLTGDNYLTSAIATAYAASILGAMVFVTSPFNDIADIEGDRAAGRRTIPIVIGKRRTVLLAMTLAGAISAISWILYVLSLIQFALALPVTAVAAVTVFVMGRTLKRLDDRNFVRQQHKKSMPLHIMLQGAIIAGMLFQQL